MKAIRLGTYKGRPVHRYPVRIIFREEWCDEVSIDTDCVSLSASDAAQWAYDQVATRPLTEILVYGPKGGVAARRFIGYESAVFNAMMLRSEETQFKLEI